MMENKNKTNQLRDLPRRIWAGLGLIGLLLSLTMPPVVPLPTARAQADFDCADVTEIPLVECQALVALYESTDGPNWNFPVGNPWFETNFPCSWHGITCLAGTITALDLGAIWDSWGVYLIGLKGSLPAEIGNLSQLESLNLSHNQLTGIPPEIGNLIYLTTLDLSFNQLTSLPPEFGSLTNLQTLNLRSNELDHLPAEFGNLANLDELELTNNLITQLPSTFGKLSKLTKLDLDNNQLVELPPEIGNLSALERLDLIDNQLTNLPAEIGNLSNLIWLELSHNQLAVLPPEIGKLNLLDWLSISTNQLVDLPVEIGELSNLRGLVLSGNQLTSLPLEIVKLSNLTWLELYYNKLSIADPVMLAFLSKVTVYYWVETQTVPPIDLHLIDASPDSLVVAWTPVLYIHGGYYELSLAEDPAGPYTVLGTTQDKLSSQFGIFNLPTRPAIYLRIRAFALGNEYQSHDLWSEYSPPLAILTAPVSHTDEIHLAYTDDDGRLNQVDIPAGTFDDRGTLYFSVQSGAELPVGQRFAGQAINLGLYHQGVYVDDLILPDRITLTLRYLESYFVEERLGVVYMDAATRKWYPAADTCSPPGTVIHGLDENHLEVQVCRLGRYTLAAAQTLSHLPVILSPW